MKKTIQVAARNAEEQSCLTVTDLPEDAVFLILSYLDIPSLGAICVTCSRLRALASSDCVWLRHSKRYNFIKDNANGQNSRYYIALKEKCRVARNWTQSKFREVTLIKNPVRLLPWLQYTDSQLWLSTMNCIRYFQVQRNGTLSENSRRLLRGPKEDVCRFVSKNNLTVCGSRDGRIYGWESSSGCLLFNYALHTSDAQCVDIIDNLVISGSRDSTVKITSMQPDREYNRLKKSLTVGTRIWSLTTTPHGSVLATGSSGCNGVPPLTTWDLNSGEVLSELGSDHKRGAGILDMKFETPYTLLTCGHDTYLRLWDLRTDRCVLKWEEPFDSALYCLATDTDNTIITGTARYGMTRRWDKRSTMPVQVYYSGLHSSPVYSLAFDSQRMYVALDLCTNMIDFSVTSSHSYRR